MKKNHLSFLLTIFLSFILSIGYAQQPGSTGPLPGAGNEISIVGGYSFGDRFEVDYGEARIDESGWLDATLSFPVKQVLNIELTYQYQPTTFSIYSFGISESYVDADVHHFLIGGVKTLRSPYPVVPFGGLKFGGVLVSPKNYDSRMWFEVQLLGGLKYFISERVGIKLQIQLNMPMQGVGASIGCGTGGCGYGVSTFTTVTQFGGGGGLVVAF